MIRKEERIEAAKQRYGEDTQYLIAKSQAFLVGAKWADETMIEKACEWLESNARFYLKAEGVVITYDYVEMIRHFKEAMKGGNDD